MGKCISCKVRRYCRKAGYRSKRVKKLTCRRPGGRTCIKEGSTACYHCQEPLSDSFPKPGTKMSIEKLIASISSIEAKAINTSCTASFDKAHQSAHLEGCEDFEIIDKDSDKDYLKDFHVTKENPKVEQLLSSISSIEVPASCLDNLATNSDDSSVDDFEFVFNPGEMLTKSLVDIKAAVCDSILSEGCNLDYPICNKCSDLALEYLEDQITMEEADSHQYRAYLKKLETETMEFHVENLEKELKDLQDQEGKLGAKLEIVQQEEATIIKMIGKLQGAIPKLIEREEKCCLGYYKCCQVATDRQDEYKSIENQLNYIESRLQKLKDINVFETIFHIWHLRGLSIINSFRLGRLPSEPVTWSEINIAWGQVALLLSALARKTNLTFKNYELVPLGSRSYIKIKSEKRIVPLYGSGGVRFVRHVSTDKAMVAFLDCLQQLEKRLKEKDKDLALPYFIGFGRITDPGNSICYSIRTQFNSDEDWTKALKFMLTNLKWSILYVCKAFASDEGESDADQVPN